MEAIGKVVAGVAHDFNNILTVITSSLEIARRDPNQSAKHKHLIQSSLRAARQGAETTQQLMTFVRGQVLQPEVLNANGVIEGNDGFIKRAVGETVNVTMKLSPNLWPVRIDRSQFETALLNLVVNARDAVGRNWRNHNRDEERQLGRRRRSRPFRRRFRDDLGKG